MNTAVSETWMAVWWKISGTFVVPKANGPFCCPPSLDLAKYRPGRYWRRLAGNQVGSGVGAQRLDVGFRREVVHAHAEIVHQPRAEVRV